MGNIFSNKSKDKKQRSNVLLIGFRGAGVNTLAYKVSMNEENFKNAVAEKYPYTETSDYPVLYDRLKIQFWIFSDGTSKTIEQELQRDIYLTRSSNIEAIILLVDSNDHDMFESNKQLLNRHLNDASIPSNAPFLIMANKQDLPNALSVDKLTETLNLQNIMGDKSWYVQSCSATVGDGLFEGLDWLSETLSNPKK